MRCDGYWAAPDLFCGLVNDHPSDHTAVCAVLGRGRRLVRWSCDRSASVLDKAAATYHPDPAPEGMAGAYEADDRLVEQYKAAARVDLAAAWHVQQDKRPVLPKRRRWWWSR